MSSKNYRQIIIAESKNTLEKDSPQSHKEHRDSVGVQRVEPEKQADLFLKSFKILHQPNILIATGLI